ncbi:Ataxin-7 Spinocerebellar ataxia type 7 protein -like protein [Takifugu flavidus]|uniref:Ataxin-7 Spinocerebellar ataxia type 7 protein-like protein n=1 Tax=Takifugu flavidus TaxID=433684 RepID=A0A5C6N7N6_9TELE|nr:Ataxin-7 Spinocerebellar ataxia type 7 protein -like protein [Takifugu flavidus]
MSERAEDDVRGEQRRAARQQLKQQQQQIQRGEGSTAMATAAERRSLPSPEIILGQPWSNWVDSAKLHGSDGAESEESFKDFGKNREAMRLCKEDMPIFGQCPAQDDFYLVMCSQCSQVVKPQAFHAHYERRHSSLSKPASTTPFPVSGRNRSSGLGPGLSTGTGAGVSGGGILSRTSTIGSSFSSSSMSSASSNPKLHKPAKEKMPSIQRRPPFPPFRMIQPDKIFLLAALFISVTFSSSLTPAVKVEKMHLRVDPSAKLVQTPSALATTSSSSTSSASTTVSNNTTAITTSSSSSSSALKQGLNCPSIPKPSLMIPGQIPNGKGHLSEKKQDSNSHVSSRRHLNKKLTEREFNPDIHCGVVDMTTRKTCTRSLTCKTHSLSQRRAVPGRRKRFDTLLAEHKNRARERERERELHQPHSQQNPSLRDSHPSTHPIADTYQVAQGNGLAPDATKPVPLIKPRFSSPALPRFLKQRRPSLSILNSSHGAGTPGDATLVHESPHHPPTMPDGFSRHSSDEGENEEREEVIDKLDCHYSGYHPRPVAYCTFGSRLVGRGCYLFDRRWDRVRCALTTMMDKHVNSQLWKKIPLALENPSTPTHRTSTNSHSSTPSSGFLSPPATLTQTLYSQSYDGKSVLSYGTTLNARSSPQGGAEHPAYGITQARQVSSSPQMPLTHSSSSSSSAPSLASGRALKSRSSSSSTNKSSSSFRPKEMSSGSSASVVPNSAGGGSSGASVNSSSTGLGSGKKRKNSSVLSSSYGPLESTNTNYSSSSSSSSSSFRKNCANVGSSGSTYHHSSLVSSSTSSLSSSHSGVHSVGLTCGPTVRTNSLSLKAEPSGGSAGGSSGPQTRGPPSGSPAESIKRMSVVMNSSDSTLSLGPFVHHQSSSDHHTSFSHHSSDGRLEGKKRKSSPASSGITSGGGAGGIGGGGGPAPGRAKVAKSPAVNNIHNKHGRSIPGTTGLPNNSHLHQPKARP